MILALCPMWHCFAFLYTSDKKTLAGIHKNKFEMPGNPKSLNSRIRKKIRACNIKDWYHERLYLEKDYITTQWVTAALVMSSVCKQCNVRLKLTQWSADDPHQFSIDRIDNSKAHTVANCQILCLQCNRNKEMVHVAVWKNQSMVKCYCIFYYFLTRETGYNGKMKVVVQ